MQYKNKIYDGIMGLVVGDAIGVPVEFKARDTFKVADMIGHGTYNQPAGTWSDDSSMTLATLESIGRLGRIDPRDIMINFKRWLCDAEFTPHGKVFDVGRTTHTAIHRFLNGVPLDQCGGRDLMDNGNGSLMRILPLAFCNPDVEDVSAVSGLTHDHFISRKACSIYLLTAIYLLAGASLEFAVNFIGHSETDEFKRLSRIKDLKRDEIFSDGYVVHTLEAALWCFFNTESYRDCILTAVNLGEDADTVAAVAGGLAGILYGVGGDRGIPEEWIEQIARKEWIKELCDQAEEALRKGNAE